MSKLLASNLGGNVLGFASGILMARFLGAEGRGSYQAAAMFWAIVPGVLTLSTGTALVLQKDQPSRRWLFTAALTFGISGSAVAWIASFMGLLPFWVAMILSATSIGYMTSDLCQGLLRRQKLYGALSQYRWIDVGGGALLIAACAFAGILTVEMAVVSLCVSTLAAVLFAWIRVWKVGDDSGTSFNWKSVPSIHGGTMLRIGSAWVDQIAIAGVLGLGPLGIYAIANSLATQFTILPSAMNTMLLRAAAESRDEGLKLLQAFSQVTVWSGALASLALAFIAPPIVGAVFGPEFEASATTAALLVVGTMFAGLILLMESFLIAQQDASYATLARAATLPSLACAVTVFAFNPTLTMGALIPVLANTAPLCFLLKRIKKGTRASLYSFIRFPDTQIIAEFAKISKKRK